MHKQLFKTIIFVAIHTMKDINKYITELLQLHDCVVLPAFGGFVASYNSATINITNGLVQPPYKNILFNKNLVHNDGLLAHYIVENSHCTMPEALDAIETYVQHIGTQITTTKRAELPQLGVLYVNDENTLLFRQSKTQEYSLASYGLPSFTANKLLAQAAPVAETNIVQLPTPTLSTETLQTQAVVRKLNYKRWAVAAVTIPALIGLVWASLNINQLQNTNFAGFTNPNTTLQNPTTPLYDRTYFEQRINKAEQSISTCKRAIDSLTQVIALKAQADTTAVSNVATTVVQQLSYAKYYLIAGCFSSAENATNYVNELKQQGYPNAQIIDGNINGLTRVAYGGYASKNDAQQVKSQLTATNAGAWIFKTMN